MKPTSKKPTSKKTGPSKKPTSKKIGPSKKIGRPPKAKEDLQIFVGKIVFSESTELALQAEIEKRGVTRSKVLRTMLVMSLRECGHDLPEES